MIQLNVGFYAYLWLREDGTPYYAGKGTGRRAFVLHRGNLRPPRDKSRILILSRESEQAALDTEKELIRNWGRKDIGTGCLCNSTAGGEIPIELSAASRLRMGEAARRNKNATGHAVSFEVRQRLREVNAGKFRGLYSKEQCRHISEGKKRGNRHLSAEHRAKLISPENRKKSWDSRFIKTVAWG